MKAKGFWFWFLTGFELILWLGICLIIWRGFMLWLTQSA